MTKFSSLIVALTLSIAIAPATAHADDPFELLGESGNYTLVALAETVPARPWMKLGMSTRR